MEQQNNIPWEGAPEEPVRKGFPTGSRELILAALLLVLSVMLCNCIFYAGFNLGFAVCGVGILAASVIYLLRAGKKPSGYAAALLILSGVILASFPRSNDGFVKFVMVCFLWVAVNVALPLTAGQNRYTPAGVRSLLDAPITFFGLGFGRLGDSFSGFAEARKNLSGRGRAGGAVVLGLVLAVPVLAVMIPLLTSADAAFDGLLSLLPEFETREFVSSGIYGIFLFPVMYTRCAALVHYDRPIGAPRERRWYMNHITVITLITVVCGLYSVYLLSQLAYFVGGFSGILPEGYSMAEYARRGFFEMAVLCGINLGLITLAIGLVKKEPAAPLALRLECLFIGAVTLFLVVSASAKMGMYIGGYGLTRLRVLTEVIMVFLGLTTALICVWLFVPRLPYMKAVLILALVMGAAVSWVDVDTVVARYNVRAYQQGKLETVDVYYLYTLSDGAVPWLQELTGDTDPEISSQAELWLSKYGSRDHDLRGWNYTTARADEILAQYDGE